MLINIFPCFTNVTNLHVYCDGSSSTALSCSSFIGAILSAVRVERSMKKLGVTRNKAVGYSHNLDTGNVSNRDTLGVQNGKAEEITVTKKFKANLARRGQLFQRGIFSQFQQTPRLLFRKLKK